MGMKIVDCHDKYLGLSTVIGRDKNKILRRVRERVQKRIDGWYCKFLSFAGKEVLIKAVLQAVPTYAMSVFKFPFGLCNKLNGLVAKFWWGKKEGKGVYWKSWESLCSPKYEGSLGFRDFEKFNQAMVGKQAWRLIEFPNSLVSRVLKARYFANTSFMQATLGNNPSFIWRSILWGRELVEKGIISQIGNGATTKIYFDRWIPRPFLFKVWSPHRLDCQALVKDLMLPSGGWNLPLISSSFHPSEARVISSIPLGDRRHEDRLT